MEGIEQGDGEDDDDKHDEGKGPAVVPELAAGVLAAHHDIGDVAQKHDDEGSARDEAAERLLFAQHARKQENGHAHEMNTASILMRVLTSRKSVSKAVARVIHAAVVISGGNAVYSLSSVAE